MKHAGTQTRRFIGLNLLGTAIVVIMIGVGCQTSPAKPEPLDSTVLRLKGGARFSVDKKPWKEVAEGNALPAGYLIQTAKDSRIHIKLGQPAGAENPFALKRPVPSRLILWENSILKNEHLAGNSSAETTKFNLRAGRMLGVISLMKHSSLEFSISNNVLRTSGGVFDVQTSGEMYVSEGSVTLEAAEGGTPIEIAAGHRFDPSTGSVMEWNPPQVTCTSPIPWPEDRDYEQFFESFEQRRNLVWTAARKRPY